jgi:hypothetical protein
VILVFVAPLLADAGNLVGVLVGRFLFVRWGLW